VSLTKCNTYEWSHCKY